MNTDGHLNILLVQHELFTWARARMWGYNLHLGLEEGFRANGADFFTLATPWMPQAREILAGRTFDQVWINDITHIHEPGAAGGRRISREDLEWLAGLAPVRLGILMESIHYRQEQYEENPALHNTRNTLKETIPVLTHIITPDENDLAAIGEIRDIPAMWYVGCIPRRFIHRDVTRPDGSHAFFSGTPYGKRGQWLQSPRLNPLLKKQVSADNQSEIPAAFDALHQAFQEPEQTPPDNPRGHYMRYLQALRELRQKAFALYLNSMRNGAAAVVLPAYANFYTGSVFEGMAAGRPMVSFAPRNAPRIAQVFADGHDILLYPDDDPEALAARVERVLADRDLGLRLARNARDTLLARHTMEHRVADILGWIETGDQPDFRIHDPAPTPQETPMNMDKTPPREPVAPRCPLGRKLRILFISPPYARFMGLGNSRFPMTFGNMATMLSMNGHETGIYDADFDRSLLGRSGNYEYTFSHQHLIPEALADRNHPVWQEIREQITAFKPDLVGISVMTTKFPMGLRIAEIVKEIDPRIPVAMGGHHATMFGPRLVELPAVDFAVAGEGEITFLELVNRLCEKDPDLSCVPGLVWHDGARAVANSRRRLLHDLDSLPVADRDLMINPGYVSVNNLMTSRGCPFNCHYCGAQTIWEHKVRRRSIENINDEIAYLFSRSPSRHISFWDDSFTMNKKFTLELMRSFGQFAGMTFDCITRLDLIDEEVVAALKAAGCTNLLFGIESGRNEILGLINKKMTTEFIEERLKLVNAAGIPWIGFFIMGYPGETREDMLATLDYMKRLDPPYAEINIFNPLPGTKIWDDLERAGKVSGDMDFSRLSQASLENYYLEGLPRENFRELAIHIIREFDRHNKEKGHGV